MPSVQRLVRCLLLAALPCLVAPRLPAQEAKDRDEQYREIAAEVSALERQTSLLKKVVRLVRPTVVHIEAAKPRPAVRYRTEDSPIEEAGSGVSVLLDERPYIITNRHVIANAALSDIHLKLADGRRLTPKAVWTDRATDIAVLQVEEESELIPARLGDSDALEIGDFVLAVGSPFGLSHSVTYGIISAKGRRDLEVGDDGLKFQNFLQTDAAINPGNSGGPLLTMRGEVIGINTAIFSASGGNEGIGFAIPIKMVTFVASQLVKTGHVSRAYLGVHLDSRFNEARARQLGLARLRGARVSAITPNSPAAAAQLRVDDIVLQFDGIDVEDDGHLINLVSLTELGKKVNLVILRGGQLAKVDVVVGERSRFEREG